MRTLFRLQCAVQVSTGTQYIFNCSLKSLPTLREEEHKVQVHLESKHPPNID